MKKLLTMILTLSCTFAFAERLEFELSGLKLPKAEVTLDKEDKTFFRTLIISDGKVIGDLINAKTIPDRDAIQEIVGDLNFCELRLGYSFFDKAPLGKVTLSSSSLNFNGTIENTLTLNGHHCIHNGPETVRQSTLYSLKGRDGGWPNTTVETGSHRLIVFEYGTSCTSHHKHAELPMDGSFQGLENGFGDLIQLR